MQDLTKRAVILSAMPVTPALSAYLQPGEPFLIDVAPSEDGVDFVLSTHEGEEFIYVLEGILEINYGKNTYILEEGDSIYYDSIVAHHVHAAADNTAKILGVIYTPY